MYKTQIIFLSYILVVFSSCNHTQSKNNNVNYIGKELHNGDLIFQTSLSNQSEAIQLATKSQYSHVGLLYFMNNEWMVLEAVQPVKLTSLNVWVKRGKDEHYIVKRLKNSNTILTNEVLLKMQNNGQKYLGKNYDLYFEWSNERIYCSELVWKIYKESANIEIGKLQTLKEFDLSHPIVQSKLKERYGDFLPENELFISPESVFNSTLLETVLEN